MTKNHLLWWVFAWLAARQPAALKRMLTEIEGPAWVKAALNERYNLWKDQ